jgi:hypothetical protein
MTPELRQRLAANKANLLAELHQQTPTARVSLLALADQLGVDSKHVRCLDDDELALLAAMGPSGWRAYLLASEDAATRHAGKVPPGDTAAIRCAHCGPVYIHPDIAAVLPVVDGWPRALGCPWCFVRNDGGHVPRPSSLHAELPATTRPTPGRHPQLRS